MLGRGIWRRALTLGLVVVAAAATFLGTRALWQKHRVDTLTRIVADSRGNHWDRAFAVVALGRIGGRRAAEGIVTALGDDPVVSNAALRVLPGMGPCATGPLIAVLRSKKGRAVCQAAGLLGQIRDTGAVDALIAVLDSGGMAVGEAAEALGQIGDTRAVPALVRHLGDRMPPPSPVSGALARMESASVEPVISALASVDANVRDGALDALCNMKSARSTEGVAAALSDRVPRIREGAVGALASRRGRDATDAIVAMCKDSDGGVRLEAFEALLELEVKDARVVDPAIGYLRGNRCLDSNTSTVVKLLGFLGDKRAIAPLIEAFGYVHAHGMDGCPDVTRRGLIGCQYRSEIIQALRRLRAPGTGPALVAAMRSGVPVVHRNDVETYIACGIPGTEAILAYALQRYGDAEMAEDCANSRNERLLAAARGWAQGHGYRLTRDPSLAGPSHGQSSQGPLWGQ